MKPRFAVAAVVVAFVVAFAPAHAAKPAKAAISSAHKLATDAGFEVLAEGGNAFDAAVAVAAALSVLEPQSSGIGGGGLFLLRRASDGKETMVDARETAPAAVDPKDYVDANGEANRDHSTIGALSAAIRASPRDSSGSPSTTASCRSRNRSRPRSASRAKVTSPTRVFSASSRGARM